MYIITNTNCINCPVQIVNTIEEAFDYVESVSRDIISARKAEDGSYVINVYAPIKGLENDLAAYSTFTIKEFKPWLYKPKYTINGKITKLLGDESPIKSQKEPECLSLKDIAGDEKISSVSIIKCNDLSNCLRIVIDGYARYITIDTKELSSEVFNSIDDIKIKISNEHIVAFW